MNRFLNDGKWFEIELINILPINWNDAKRKDHFFEGNWKFPTIDELEAIFEQLHKTGEMALPEEIYWSSSEFSDDAAWYFDFKSRMAGTAVKKLAAKLIAVKEMDEQQTFATNDKIIAFGDIHGCFDTAVTAIALAREKYARAIFLGDYIDRGPSSIKTIQLMINAKRNNPDLVFLRGNHEQMLLDLIEERALPTDDIFVLEDTESSYKQASDTFSNWKKLNRTEQNEIIDFLRNTKLYFEWGDWIFVHAVLRNTKESLSQKSNDELIWNYKNEPFWEGKRFVHGHLLVDNVKFVGKGININTKCGYGGVLTGLKIDNASGDNYETYKISEDGEILN